MMFALKTRALDTLDSVYLKVMARPDLPPYTLRCHVGPAIEYEQLPAEYIAYFKLLAGLRMTDAILDVGCGTGRFASQLLGRPNFFRGTYRGFDIDTRAIAWARGHIESTEADLHFDRVDLFNDLPPSISHLLFRTFVGRHADNCTRRAAAIAAANRAGRRAFTRRPTTAFTA